MKNNLRFLIVTFVYFIYFLLGLLFIIVTFQFRKFPLLIKVLNEITEWAKKNIYEKN
jgi:hypothetical protein